MNLGAGNICFSTNEGIKAGVVNNLNNLRGKT